jgi:hypothetical protein
MRTFIHGTDRGSAVMAALILIFLLSFVFITFTARISALKRYADEYKASTIRRIEQSNGEF